MKRPTASGTSPQDHSGWPSKSNVTRSVPYSAVFSITPLNRADTGEGAAGCASGSHTCSGTRPAFAPKPNSASRNATVAQVGVSCAARIASNVNCQLPPCMTPNDSRMPIAPRCAISRYRKPARRISGSRCCVVTRKYDDSAIVSQATMNAYASSASSTNPMLARNTWYWRHSSPGAVPAPLRK